MKKFIEFILGDFLVFKLKGIKNKIIPGKTFISEQKLMESCRNFYSKFITNGDLCFDVGANMGNKVQPLLALHARVVAIEPQKTCQKYLMMKFGERITIVPKGLGEKEEIKEFYISNASTISSFSKEWIDAVKKERFKNYSWETINSVQITTLDNLISLYGLPVFIKIDVEGYELEVLKGLSRQVSMISFEYTVPEQINKIKDCINQLLSVNSGIEFNYCKTDIMEFRLDDWVTAKEMFNVIDSEEFKQTGFGDVYARSNVETS